MSIKQTPSFDTHLTPVDFDPFAGASLPAILPLTDSQQEVWAACQMAPQASTAYNQCFPFRLEGRLSLESMRSALAGLVRRHEALRVTFDENGDRQVIAPIAEIPIATLDVSLQSPERRAQAIENVLAQECAQPFDLVSGPLARVHLIREADDVHVLVFTAHHIVCDGWSSGILFQDLAELYNADRHGLTAQLPEPASYQDYVRRATNRTADDAATEEYWVQRFGGGAPVLELPIDRPRPPVKTFRGSHERVTFDSMLYREIKRVGARYGCTLYVTLLAAWQVLLYRLTSQTDLTVGIPLAGQAIDGDRLVGHCVHMLPLAAELDPFASFAAQLTATRRAVVDAHEHRAITFGRLVRRLNLPRDSSHMPLLSAVFNVDRPTDPPVFEGLQLDRLVAPRSGINFELGLDIADTGTELQIDYSYNADLFDASTIRRWLGYYRTLLTSVIADAGTPIDRVDIVPAPERAALRSPARRLAIDGRSLHRAFEAVADRTPDAVAVRCEGESVTYGALNRRANQIAHHLRALGVGPEALVAVCLDRSIELVAAILGILKAGGAYVPIDPECPVDRVRLMMQDAECSFVIATDERRGHFQSSTASIVAIDGDRPAIARNPDANPDVDVSPEHLAYVIFTSGSTGRPKGVAVTHANVSRLFSATERLFDFGHDDVWTLFHSVAFDFSVWEMWGALLHGGRLVVVPYWISRSPDAVHDLLRRERVTVLNQTPSAFRQLIEADRMCGGSALALRLVIFGGEALELPALRGWIDRHGDEQPALVNMFGITETTVHVTYRRVTADDIRAGYRSPIGVPLPDLDVHLLSPSGELVPTGVAGEICVAGGGVARGYVNRPELSSERFIPNPFGDRSGDRLYRSGDLARRLANGDLQYLGRIDHQVKIRGFRVELGEIDAALSEHPAVREATVALTKTAGGDSRVVAYVVRVSGAAAGAGELLAHMRGRLPEYMVPNAFVFLDALPINENGKLDRGRLPAPEHASGTSADRVGARTPAEQALVEIWRDVLDVPEVGIHDSFFDLGGHSMLAVKIVSRVRQRFAIDLSMAALFHAPTIAGLAEVVEALAPAMQPWAHTSADREVIEL